MKVLIPPNPADVLDDISVECADYAKLLRNGAKLEYLYPAIYQTRAQLSKLLRESKWK